VGLCKGNRGNLLQHWTLCESLASLANLGISNLHLACTHSMAPWTLPVRKVNEATDTCRRFFRTAANRLAHVQNPNIYESAWHRLSVSSGLPYPSTAVFASAVWQGVISLALCEASPHVADEIDGWLNGPAVEQRFAHSVLLRGDWRTAVASPLFTRPSSECIYIEMDPMRYDSRDSTIRP